MSDPVKRPAEAAMESERQKRLRVVFDLVKSLRSECLGPPPAIPLDVISEMLLSKDFDPATALNDWNERCDIKSTSLHPESDFDAQGEPKSGKAVGDPPIIMTTEKPDESVLDDSDFDDEMGDGCIYSFSNKDPPDPNWVPATNCYICGMDINDHAPVDCPDSAKIHRSPTAEDVEMGRVYCGFCQRFTDHVSDDCPHRDRITGYKLMPDGTYKELDCRCCHKPPHSGPCKWSPCRASAIDSDLDL